MTRRMLRAILEAAERRFGIQTTNGEKEKAY